MSGDQNNQSKSTKTKLRLKNVTLLETNKNSNELTLDAGFGKHPDRLFDNLPGFISPSEIPHLLPIALSTVYDWVYRPRKYGVPEALIVKFGRKVFIRTSELEKWLTSRGANQGRES